MHRSKVFGVKCDVSASAGIAPKCFLKSKVKKKNSLFQTWH